MSLICKRCEAEDMVYLQVFGTYQCKNIADTDPYSMNDVDMTHLGRYCCGNCGKSSKRLDLIAKESK